MSREPGKPGAKATEKRRGPEAESNIVRFQQQTTPAWDAPNGVFNNVELQPGKAAPLEITPLSRFIAVTELQQDIIEAMKNGGIEKPELQEQEPVTDAELDQIEAEMEALFEERIKAEEERRARGEHINGYHDERHNKQVAERLIEIFRAMKDRIPHELARIMVLEIAPEHDRDKDKDGNPIPHPGVAVRKEADGLSIEQISHSIIDASLRKKGVSLYRRIEAAGIQHATANFWDSATIEPKTKNEYIFIIGDLGGYREHYAEWARQSVGVLSERIQEMKRDLSIYEAKKGTSNTVDGEVIQKLRAARPADSLVGFFKFQRGFAAYLDEGIPQKDGSVFGQVNKKFAESVIEGGEEAWPWTHQLREHKKNLAALLAAAEAVEAQGGNFEEYWQKPSVQDTVEIETVQWLQEQLTAFKPELAEIDQRIAALAA